MDKYLLEILQDKNTIIIPGLGALTITNKKTGAIKFMPYLTHDDGALSLYISESEGMEENDSKNLIAKYVREIHAELDKGGSYDMYEFGSFFKSGDEIEFKSWGSEQNQKTNTKENKARKEDNSPIEDDTKQTTTKEQTSKKPAVKKTGAKKKTEEKQGSEKPSKTPDKIKQEKNTKDTTANKDKEIEEKQVKTEPKNLSNKEKQKLNIIQKEELSSNEKKLDELKHQSNTNSNKSRRGVGFWMLLSLMLLIIAGGTYIAVDYNNVKQHIPFLADSPQATDKDKPEKMKQIIGENKQTESSTDQIIVSESNQINNTNIDENEEFVEELEEEAVETETKEEVRTQIPSSNKNTFHIIAGAFSSESNAKLMGNKLKAKGYKVKVGRGRGMNLVSIKSFPTREKAKRALAEFKEVAANCWVYEWK